MKPIFYAFNGKEPKHLDDLSYVIGVLLGDASLRRYTLPPAPWLDPSIQRYTWSIELNTRDLEFAETFVTRLNHVIKRQEKRVNNTMLTNVKLGTNRRYHRIVKRSRSFGDWYSSLTPEEKTAHALKYPADFLAGIYDSEGNLSMNTRGHIREIRILTASEFTRDLTVQALDQLGIGGKWRLFRKAGTSVSILGRRALSQVDLFVVSPCHYREFFRHVRSSIPRKNPPE